MPRRVNDIVQVAEPPKKKSKVYVEVMEQPSLDTSFFDDEALPPGIIFTDIQKKKWRIGKPVGRGSFGRIYLASDDVEKEVIKSTARYVVKIEPHTNGPLFVEIHCLIRTGQIGNIKKWRHEHKQKHLGMPVYIASGSFTDENTGTKYRFLVLPRYDIDLQKIIARTRVLDMKNVLVLALQILDVLEYLHNQGYTHSDIKSSNLMLGFEGTKIFKVPFAKPTPSFEKETKDVPVLSRKHRKSKAKSRTSNYYDDEDFVVRDHKVLNNLEVCDNDKRLAKVKNKLRKILSDKDSRTLHRHHAFNLRQLSNYVNYEDFNSSVCSDQSYQKLLDDFGNFAYTHEGMSNDKKNGDVDLECNLDNIYQEAILSQSNGQIYLLDYGLASRFLDSEGKHKEFGMDARKAHDGTLEYSSRDSHIGAHSRRSDLETLGYNLLDWLTGSLPWKTSEVLAEPDLVHALKKKFMSDTKAFLRTCFKTDFYPVFIEKYLQYITNLEYTEKPDYDYCRGLFKKELLKIGCVQEISLNFNACPISPKNQNKLCYSKRFAKKNTPPDFLARNGITKMYERENVFSLENDLKLELLKQTLNSSSDGVRKPCASRNFFVSDADLVARLKKSLMPLDVFGKKLSPKNLRSNKKNITKRRGKKTHRNSIGKFGNFMGSAKQFTWAEILARNPEDLLRKDRNTAASDDEDEETCKYRIRKLSNSSSDSNSDPNLQSPLLQKDYLQGLNPTYAMKEIVENLKKKVQNKISKDYEPERKYIEGYNREMLKIHAIKVAREAKEKIEMLKQNFCKKEVVIATTRCTRSKRINITKNDENSKVTKRVTRMKATTLDKEECIPQAEKKTKPIRLQAKSKDKKGKSNNKKKEDTVPEVESTPVKLNKKAPVKRKCVAVPTRRKLRSSRRKTSK